MTDEMQSFVDFQRSENALFSGFYLTCSGWQVTRGGDARLKSCCSMRFGVKTVLNDLLFFSTGIHDPSSFIFGC